MKWRLTFIFTLLLFGCSHSPGYYRSPPDICDGAAGCAASAIIDGIIHSKPAPKKCSEMNGKQREKYNAQVDAVSESIKRAQGY